MKKYFMKGTDDELQFGDVIELDFVGEEDGVRKHSHFEVEFKPEYIEELLEEEVIEEREGEEEDDLINFEDYADMFAKHDQMLELLTEKVKCMEADLKAEKEVIAAIQKSLKANSAKK